MAANQAIEYAPQCGDLTVESLVFHNNNVVAETFTKTPSVVYQNFLREFWCTAIAYDPNPPINDSKARPLKEYLIKFTVMNGKKPLILDYKTFVLHGNYSSTEFISCTLEVLLGSDYTQDESFGSSPTILSNLNFSKDPSKVTQIELTAFMVAGPEASGSLPQKRKNPKSKKPTPETQVTPPSVPTEDSKKTQSVPSGQTAHPQDTERNTQHAVKGFHSPLDEGTRKSQPLPKVTIKTKPLPEGPHGDKGSEGFKPPADMELLTTHVVDPSRTDAKYQVDQTQSTRLRYRSLTKNKGETSSKVELDNQTLLLSTAADVQALLLSDKELMEESEDDVFEAGDEMDEEIHHTDEEETQSPLLNKDQPESSHAQDTESDSDSSCPEALKKYDNVLPLTKRNLV
ncbi:hypothetical protein Tco_0599137 [Tanacetum coccineum]